MAAGARTCEQRCFCATTIPSLSHKLWYLKGEGLLFLRHSFYVFKFKLLETAIDPAVRSCVPTTSDASPASNKGHKLAALAAVAPSCMIAPLRNPNYPPFADPALASKTMLERAQSRGSLHSVRGSQAHLGLAPITYYRQRPRFAHANPAALSNLPAVPKPKPKPRAAVVAAATRRPRNERHMGQINSGLREQWEGQLSQKYASLYEGVNTAKAFERIDKNRDGVMDREEVITQSSHTRLLFLHAPSMLANLSHGRACAPRVDRGRVQVLKAMLGASLNVSAADLDRLMHEADTNGDGASRRQTSIGTAHSLYR